MTGKFSARAGQSRYRCVPMADENVYHLLLYEYVPEMERRREPYREAHRARIAAEREAGRMVAAGAFDPVTGGALVFSGVDRAHVEAFAAADPYMEAGLISSWRVHRWGILWDAFGSQVH
jgi:uncharacterized protein YciI